MPPEEAPTARRKELRIASHPRDGWEVMEGTPLVGAVVVAIDGYAEVVRVLGRVSDGSRLLELKFLGRDRSPYFAATSNVLQKLVPA